MSKIQLLAVAIHLGGERNNTVVRDATDPITFPEMQVLQAIHGGAEHVHSAVDVGSVERTSEEEMERLSNKYGRKVVTDIFPVVAGRVNISRGDDKIPTLEEEREAADAADEARAKTKARKSAKSEPAK